MNSFRQALRTSDFVVTATLNLNAAVTRNRIENDLATLRNFVDAVQVGDNRNIEGHMSGLAIASIAREANVDCVVSLSCRDRNRIALQADILAAAALGVTSLVLVRGDKLPKSDQRKTRGVFDVTAVELIELARAIGNAESLVSPPGFCIGSRVVAFDPDADWQAGRIREKIEAGCDFFQTQPCLNAGACTTYLARLIKFKFLHRVSVMVEVPLLTNAAAISAIKQAVPGAAIPNAIVERIDRAKDPVTEGMEVAAEVIQVLRNTPGVAGVNITHDGDVKNIVAVIDSGRKSNSACKTIL